MKAVWSVPATPARAAAWNASARQAAAASMRNSGTNATMQTPPPAAMVTNTSSGTVREESVTARAHEWLNITGAFGVPSAQDAPATSSGCRASAADLQHAAEAARVLQAQRPELFEQSPRPASYQDLRLAAEWSYRLSYLDADSQPDHCNR